MPDEPVRALRDLADLPEILRRKVCYVHPPRICSRCFGMMVVDLQLDPMLLVCEQCENFLRVQEYGREGLAEE
jgi:hypothetical protein